MDLNGLMHRTADKIACVTMNLGSLHTVLKRGHIEVYNAPLWEGSGDRTVGSLLETSREAGAELAKWLRELFEFTTLTIRSGYTQVPFKGKIWDLTRGDEICDLLYHLQKDEVNWREFYLSFEK